MGKLDYNYKIDKLTELLKAEHGDCDDTTCDMASCLDHGYDLWAIKLFSSTGASSSEFNQMYNTLPAQFEIDADAERAKFVENVPSVVCPHCDSVVYSPEQCDYYCSGCAEKALFEVKLNCGSSDGVVASGASNWVEGFSVIKEKEISDGVIYSIAMKYGKQKSEFNKSILDQSIGSETPPNTKMEFLKNN